MPSVSPKFTWDFRPKTVSDFLHQISLIANASDRVSRLGDFINSLEEEMKKIDAFKRELPFCMLLLNDAILALKGSSLQCVSSSCSSPKTKPVLEEFISLNKDSPNDNEKKQDCRDKKEWMSSVQLWNSDDFQNTQTKAKRNEGCGYLATAADDRFPPCRNKNEERLFVGFKSSSSAFPAMAAVNKQEKMESPMCALSLVTPSLKNPKQELGSCVLGSSGNRATLASAPDALSNLRTVLPPQHQQPARKQRRCWSPELHRRFVNALQQLGGSQVATPKQIREMMQVDGLTNDEVKSHLQKYRLHTRRLPSTPATGAADRSPVVLGDLWTSQDGCGESSKVSSSQSASPQGPFQLAGNGGYSTTGGDSMEDEEDTKSESYEYLKTEAHTSKR
ncbi:transcription factor HHO6-like [Cucurbita pepo subsp. pepo]|uniref:transcription factor HHO6-like n=1 Tax=Cucurbita pepo subsp. pepo TaxID=3664 RepID=UPI000C9D3F8A|nr:transcription factor HHO6-like [Cucurbita pepo subsp. pepo]